ncbi:hypothetical protein F66182_489 [Fusarium sp. NRRL 66182]|nr:hypothetical protein F66182_489 [Fusarium sp. NRRL 66182]
MASIYSTNSTYTRDSHDTLQLLRPETICLSSFNPSAGHPTRSIGRPWRKKKIHLTDLLSAIVALMCLALGIASVETEFISWYLGQGTYQLIVLGFLLSIMNLCFETVTPILFLLLEARFGNSSLQNYEAILSRAPMASKLTVYWRLILGLMIALPMALSVAYKSFDGGKSSRAVDAPDYDLGKLTCGHFSPPGLQLDQIGVDILLFFNITLPFTIATSRSSPDQETALPSGPRAYGFNTLFLNNESVAILDTPNTDLLTRAQSTLKDGESWNLTASVAGTVATFNRTKEEDFTSWNATFMDACGAAKQNSSAFRHQSLMNNHAIDLVNQVSPGGQFWQYLCLVDDTDAQGGPSCRTISRDCERVDGVRRWCRGTWSITRGGIVLLDGDCKGDQLPPNKQLIIRDHGMALGVSYVSSLRALLGPFAEARKGSEWISPSFAAATAGMIWSKITDKNGPAFTDKRGYLRWWLDQDDEKSLLTFEEAGLEYDVDVDIVYIRPTLRKSPLLYMVLGVQPLLIVVVLTLRCLLYPVPVDKGFGLASILAGLDASSIAALHGAGLSGELLENVKLIIRVIEDDGKQRITYTVAPIDSRGKQGSISPGVIYY